MSHSVPICTVSPTHKMFIEMSRWPDLRPLVSAIPKIVGWALIKAPLGYSVAALGHGDSSVIVPQDSSLHGLQHVKDGVAVRMGQPKAQDVGLGRS